MTGDLARIYKGDKEPEVLGSLEFIQAIRAKLEA